MVTGGTAGARARGYSIGIIQELPVNRYLRSLAIGALLSAFAWAQSDVVVPNENLVEEGVPKIPAALADTVDRYTNFRGAYLESWDPVKREMLISTRFADTNQIHHLSMPGGARTQLTFYPDSVAGAQYPPTHSGVFVFSKDVGGGEFYQLYRYDVATGEVTLLTDGKSRNTGAVWSYAGDKLAYGSTRRTGNDVDLYVMDPANPKSDHLLAKLDGGGWEVQDWSADGGKLLVMDEISANESSLWLFDAATGEKTLLTPQARTGSVAYSGGQFSKDGKGIYTTTDKDSEFHRLAYIDLATREHSYLTSQIPWDVDEFDLSFDGKTMAFVTQ